MRAYSMTIQLTILITSLGLLAGYLITEFAVPLALKDGRTLGKRIFGLAVMRSDGVRISPVLLFVRTVLGKYALETMIPVFIVMMMFWGNLGIVGLAVLILIPVLEIIVMIRKFHLKTAMFQRRVKISISRKRNLSKTINRKSSISFS